MNHAHRPSALVLLTLLVACDKPAPAPGPASSPTAATWPDEPGGALWEALARVPAWNEGKVGVLDFGAALKPHPAWGEAEHGRASREFERFFVKRLALPAADASELIWAELRATDRNGYERVRIAKVTTDPERLRAALRAGGFAPEEGVEGGWRRVSEDDPAPELVAFRGGWLLWTYAGPEVFAKVLDAWSGKVPDARTVAHARALAAGLPRSRPAVLRFGIEEQPIFDSPLRVIAMALAPDAGAGEEVVVVAFNAENGPETMTASENWKKHVGVLTPRPRVDRKGACLRVATRPEADPGFVAARRKEVEARLRAIRDALEQYRVEQGRYPEALAALAVGEFPAYADDLWDPWGSAYVYELGEGSFALKSHGPDGQEGTADDISSPR